MSPHANPHHNVYLDQEARGFRALLARDNREGLRRNARWRRNVNRARSYRVGQRSWV